MVVVILGMLLVLALALLVVAVVAVPAVKEGEELLTPEGRELVQDIRGRAGETVTAAREKVGASR